MQIEMQGLSEMLVYRIQGAKFASQANAWIARPFGTDFAESSGKFTESCSNDIGIQALRYDVKPSLFEQGVDADVAKLLILEDYLPLLRVLAVLLRRAGYHVTLARTGREASQLLSQQHYDLLVMDFDISITDVECVIQALQATSRRLPVVALLSPQSHWIRNVPPPCVHTLLYKPIGRQALLRGIERGLKA